MRRPLIVGCLFVASLFLVVGCCQNSRVGDIEQQNMAVIRAAHAALEKGDLFIEEFIVAVPEYEDTLGPMMASGDMVAYVSTMKGVQTGPMGDLPPTGREFTLVNIIIQRLEDGKVAETWVSWDNVAFLSQLGHFPPPASGGE
ncbi:MAG: ester cyclase [Acidobacteriota bacterium]